ncbi:MAG: ATP synthase F0 subunit B [Flavobacteriaceae bacterium]|nr:MAG: ATP synthase F0 subunit B [Flavobacteriaceae bacterium]
MDKLIHDFGLGLFFWQAAIFLALLFLLRKFAWKPILDALDERESSIEDALNNAKKAREEMDLLKAENQKVLKEAKIERDNMLKEARDSRDKIIEEAKTKASAEVATMMEIAKKSIENEKMSALVELKNNVAQLSIEMAEKVLGGELKDKPAQENLVKSLIKDANLS